MGESFGQSDTPYFHADRPRSIIKSLASVSSLVLYCGAGVTIDRTSLGWSELVRRVFTRDDAEKWYPTAEEIRLLASSQESPRVSSALYAYVLDGEGSDEAVQTFLTPRLAQALYNANSWQEGRLTRNVAQLALYAAARGIEVTVFTTNYDTYIEQAMVSLRKEMEVPQTSPLPGLCVTVVGVDDSVTNLPPEGEGLTVRLVYLHGRVRNGGGHDGHIVLTEADYSMTNEPVRATLQVALDRDGVGALVLGSSLVDAPLLDALLATRQRADRFALVPIESIGFTSHPAALAGRLTEHARRRGDGFGLKISCPDFKYQVAQFCSELLLAVTHPDGAEHALADSSNLRYGLRLLTWWDLWIEKGQGVPGKTPEEALWSALMKLKASVDTIIRAASTSADRRRARDEQFRIELWVRRDPAKDRSLVMWGTSEGPVFDRHTLRSHGLGLGTSNASVAAFIEGRPLHIDVADLPATAMDGRWKSFLSVPVFVSPPNSRSAVPVGTITIASTFKKANSLLPLRRTTDMEKLIQAMRQGGLGMLAVSKRSATTT